MNRHLCICRALPAALVLATALAALPSLARAHCDTLDGPVVVAARQALAAAEITPVLIWVQPEQEAELRTAFDKTLEVRAAGGAAQELSDMYFFETLVRLHRAGEGAPYTGLKPAGSGITPALAAADGALESGSADELEQLITALVLDGLRERFEHAHALKPHVSESIESGREYVEAYVTFVHYAEALEAATAGTGGHTEGAPATDSAPEHQH